MISSAALPDVSVESQIYFVRGHRVMLDRDLASLYGVPVGALIQATKRNRDRFPEDFVFRLTLNEWKSLRSQFVILEKSGRGEHPKYLPHGFTEQGVAMLSSVLRSKRAVAVNIGIMRAFVRFRQLMGASKAWAEKLSELEKRVENHDENIHAIFQAIRELMEPPAKPAPKIVFQTRKK